MNYWQERIRKAQEELMDRTINQVDTQLKKYYFNVAKKCIDDFEATYNKLLADLAEGREPTPADLYKMDKYWQLQVQVRDELQKLGDRKIKLLSKAFEENWFDTYYAIVIPNIDLDNTRLYNTIDKSMVQQMINQIWCADGKTWSQRIWADTDRLAADLNDELIHIVSTGKSSKDLINKLRANCQERFDMSYRRAATLVRTEVAHIQTEAAKKRYEDYGVQEVEVIPSHDYVNKRTGRKTETCEKCKALEGKRFPVGSVMPLPVHPNERCCLVPVIE